MKTAFVITALAGAASAALNAAQLLRSADPDEPQLLGRQDDSAISPGDADLLSGDCREADKKLFAALPTTPPELLDFSSAFYKTASRTATETWSECAWVTNLPGSVHTPFMEFQDEIVEWYGEKESLDLAMEVAKECRNDLSSGNYKAERHCGDEWDEFTVEVMEEHDWTPPELPVIEIDSNGNVEKPNGAAGLSVGRSTYAVAAVLGTFLGGVALL